MFSIGTYRIAFTFMHLADAFIQSDLHCIQVTALHFISSCFPWVLKCNLFLRWQSWIFSIITPVFSVILISLIADFLRKKHFLLLLSMFKIFCCLIFLWKPWNTTIQKSRVRFFLKKLILLYSKNPLNLSKMTVKVFTNYINVVLLKFLFLLKKYPSQFPQKY